MAQLNFDARTVEPQQALTIIPAGWYNVSVSATEMKPTQDKTGSYLQLELTVLDGPAAGRKIFDRLNLQNKNPTATEIAYRTLSAICHAVNLYQLEDSDQLINRPLMAKVSVRPARGDYEESNEVKGYKACEGQAGGPAGVPPAQAMPQQPAAPQQQAAAPAGFQAPQQPAQQPQQFQQPQQTAQPAQQPAQQEAAPAWGQPAQQAQQTAAPAGFQQPADANTPPWQQPQQ